MAQIRDSEEKLQLQTKEINTSFFTTDRAVGGPSGGDFFVGVKKGTDVPVTSTATVRSLKAWYDSNSLRGIQVRLTDGTVTLVGEKSSDKETDEFYFADGEKVASLKIWYNKFFDGRCGKVELVTTQQNRRFIIDAKTTSTDYYEPEIGSGILFGVFGTSGSDIDSLGFALLRRVQSAVLTNVSYPEISTLLITTKPREIKSITYDNTEGTVEQSFTFSGSQSVEESETWSVTAGIESSVETEVKAGVPLLAEGKVTVSVTVSVEGTYERSTTKTSEQAFEFPINVPPGKRVLATATMYEGVIDTKYNATIYYTLDSDVSFNFEIKDGTYKGIQASQAVVSVEEYTDSFFDRPVFSSSQTIVHP